METDELKRYSRQIMLPELGLQGQEQLKAAKVLMVGAGGLGCPALQYLAAAGFGHIGIIDNDLVDESNLHRQILYSAADIGKPKAEVAKQKLQALNPFINIVAYTERLTDSNAHKLFDQFDVIIDGSDNFLTRYLVNDVCVSLNKVLVFGSIFKFDGQVSVFNYKDGPNYRDLYPEAPLDKEVPNCSDIGVLGVVPGIIGMYMAGEVIKVICGIGEILSGGLLTINMLNNTTTIYKIAKPTRQEPGIPSSPLSSKLPDQEISIDEFKRSITESADDYLLVDVREVYEFEDHNIGGINIPLYELKEQLHLLPPNKKLIFCCQTGQRSKIAVQLLKGLYQGSVFTLTKGILNS